MRRDRIFRKYKRIVEKIGKNLPGSESKVQASSWGWGEVKVPREFPGTEPTFSQEP